MSEILVHERAGGRVYGGAGPKRLRKKTLKFDRKSPKTKKNERTIKMCGISSEIAWQTFSRFWTRFDPLLAILLVLRGRAYTGELGKKDSEKN